MQFSKFREKHKKNCILWGNIMYKAGNWIRGCLFGTKPSSKNQDDYNYSNFKRNKLLKIGNLAGSCFQLIFLISSIFKEMSMVNTIATDASSTR